MRLSVIVDTFSVLAQTLSLPDYLASYRISYVTAALLYHNRTLVSTTKLIQVTDL